MTCNHGTRMEITEVRIGNTTRDSTDGAARYEIRWRRSPTGKCFAVWSDTWWIWAKDATLVQEVEA